MRTRTDQRYIGAARRVALVALLLLAGCAMIRPPQGPRQRAETGVIVYNRTPLMLDVYAVTPGATLHDIASAHRLCRALPAFDSTDPIRVPQLYIHGTDGNACLYVAVRKTGTNDRAMATSTCIAVIEGRLDNPILLEQAEDPTARRGNSVGGR